MIRAAFTRTVVVDGAGGCASRPSVVASASPTATHATRRRGWTRRGLMAGHTTTATRRPRSPRAARCPRRRATSSRAVSCRRETVAAGVRPRRRRSGDPVRRDDPPALADAARADARCDHRPGSSTGPAVRPIGCSWPSAAASTGGSLSYAETLAEVRRIGAGAARSRRLARPSGRRSCRTTASATPWSPSRRSHVGIPVVPVSPAYSLLSTDFAKLRAIFALVEPGLVWTDDPGRFAAALDAVGATGHRPRRAPVGGPGSRVARARAAVTRDTVAKMLFTSGSTGTPKGVINTHGMLVANQQMLAQGWPFLDRPPAGDRRLAAVEPHLRRQPQLQPGAAQRRHAVHRRRQAGAGPGSTSTVRNLTAMSPTMYFNVPRGFDLLLPSLESDAALRRTFFRELDAVFYAAAALPQNLWERLEALAVAEGRDDLAMLSAWGSTETSPLATPGALPHRARRRHRPAGRRVRAEAGARGGQARGARARAARHPGLLPARRPDRGRLRRRGLLPDRRCGALRRPGRSVARPGLRRPRGRGLQAARPAPGSTPARCACG